MFVKEYINQIVLTDYVTLPGEALSLDFTANILSVVKSMTAIEVTVEYEIV
jgi:hypothetical protein